MSSQPPNRFYNIEKSALITVLGILLLFSTAVIVTLVAPRHLDPSWTQPTTPYMMQVYEVVDPNLYISSTSEGSSFRQYVYHVKQNETLLAFQESEKMRIKAPPELEKYVTRWEDKTLKLTSNLLLLRKVQGGHQARVKEDYDVLELYAPEGTEAFAAIAASEGGFENWVDEDYRILDEEAKQPWHQHSGVVYLLNPEEYRLLKTSFGEHEQWQYHPAGEKIKNVEELQTHPLGFVSRQTLIEFGEHLFAIEGCWYCHTDQTRTLIQDVVLNGSDSFPAPPSTANEYIYQKITFPGTRRIGPDLSRVGVKRPSRDWHKAHFWSPKTASAGSIMPSFHHFFDDDPRGTGKPAYDLPNYKFEAIFQYLMTKGTRITPPTQAWWLGKDPVNTLEIIEGRK